MQLMQLKRSFILSISNISRLTFQSQMEPRMIGLFRKKTLLYDAVSSNFPLAENLIHILSVFSEDTYKILPQTKTWENPCCV